MLTPEEAAALARPFAESEIEWRVGQAGTGDRGPWVKVLAYLTARAVMDRLDEVFGVGGWSHSIREAHIGNAAGIICRIEARGVAHEDIADASDIEAMKGAASGALKRAAVHFGIGRYLYFLEEGWGVVSDRGRFKHSGKDKNNNHLNFRWDPPALPAWALPPKGSERFNPYNPGGVEDPKRAAQDSTMTDPSGVLDYSKEIPDGPFAGLIIPDEVDQEFVARVVDTLTAPKGVQSLRGNYKKALEKLALLGVQHIHPEVIDPKAYPAEIANHLLAAKASIVAAERKAA